MNTAPDRFIYEGRPLREWLLQLVEETAERRLAASTAVNDHLSRVDIFAQPEWSLDQVTEEFQKAIREILREPSFPHAEYVKKLVSLKLQLAQQYTNLLNRYKTPTVNEAVLTGIALNSVIDALGEELLPGAEQLRLMLKDPAEIRTASRAIARMGPAALEFYPDLMEGLKKPDLNGEYPMPLGSLLQYHPKKIPLIVELTDCVEDDLRRNAIATLRYCGRETIRLFPEIEATARARLKESTSDDWSYWARMLGETAVTSETVTLFLETTRASENWRVGMAIECLGNMGLASQQVVPRLVELLDEFEEYDSDWGWAGGPHARIISALAKHGAAAKTAIPKLRLLIWSVPHHSFTSNNPKVKQSYPDAEVIQLLGSFGSEARDALPDLLEMKTELLRREKINGSDTEALTNVDEFQPDYLREAIARIEGKQ